MKATQRKNN